MKNIQRIITLSILLWMFLAACISVEAEAIDYKQTSKELLEFLQAEEAVPFDDELLKSAGTSASDWFAFGVGRHGTDADYAAYLAVLENNVSERYLTKEKLSETKATEWHRIALTVLALGGDPTEFGVDEDGNLINLIAEGVYNRGLVTDLAEQGINGLTWGLLTLDALDYEVPQDAFETREQIIKRILELQLEDGGFSLKFPPSDIDLTAMALQSLAPYYNSEKTYTYTRIADQKNRTVRVRDVVDEALEMLSKRQTSSASFESFEIENTESIVQVIVALTALKIDLTTDERFIKNNQTLIDALSRNKQSDGGFIHSETYDEENPTAKPDESNRMASEQALYGLSSLIRSENNLRRLYDFRPEMSEELKDEIELLELEIEALNKNTSQDQLKLVLEMYKNIPVDERSYVKNYAKLSDLLSAASIDPDLDETWGKNKKGKGTVTSLLSTDYSDEVAFTKKDLQIYKELPEAVTTKEEVTVLKLLDKLETELNETGEHKSEYISLQKDLIEKKKAIDLIKSEINNLNQTILDELYPFESITVKDKTKVDGIKERYNKLSKHDQSLVQNYEDVEKAATQIKSLERARWIKLAGVVILIGLSLVLLKRRMKGKVNKTD